MQRACNAHATRMQRACNAVGRVRVRVGARRAACASAARRPRTRRARAGHGSRGASPTRLPCTRRSFDDWANPMYLLMDAFSPMVWIYFVIIVRPTAAPPPCGTPHAGHARGPRTRATR